MKRICNLSTFTFLTINFILILVTSCKTEDPIILPQISTVLIPAGTFTMGSPNTDEDRFLNEIPQHLVTLSAFRMSKFEITNAQYADFLNAKNIGSSGSYVTTNYGTQVLIYESSGIYDWGLHYSDSHWKPVKGYENFPVIFVTWYGATEYATYIHGNLPTEAQWEYACRAGTITLFNSGNFLTNLQANYDWSYTDNRETYTKAIPPRKTQAVGTYTANAFGLYDMHGNVWEMCADRYGTYPDTAQTNPTGASTDLYRIIRGGGWNNIAYTCRSAQRSCTAPDSYCYNTGFRVVFAP